MLSFFLKCEGNSHYTEKKNIQKSMMHVQSCCFANLNLLLFCLSHWHRHRCCLTPSLPEYNSPSDQQPLFEDSACSSSIFSSSKDSSERLSSFQSLSPLKSLTPESPSAKISTGASPVILCCHGLATILEKNTEQNTIIAKWIYVLELISSGQLKEPYSWWSHLCEDIYIYVLGHWVSTRRMYVYILGREGVKLPKDGIREGGGGGEFEP